MRRLLRKARTLDLYAYKRHRGFLDNSVVELEFERASQITSLGSDVKAFFEQIFGFTPFKYQLELADLFEKNQFTAVRWSRQTVKSFCVLSFFSFCRKVVSLKKRRFCIK
jgi:hypothetical protein